MTSGIRGFELHDKQLLRILFRFVSVRARANKKANTGNEVWYNIIPFMLAILSD